MDQISFDDLFNDANQIDVQDTPPLYNFILELLQSNINSAIEICESLMEKGYISKVRYSTNKPKAYSEICSTLDYMVKQDLLILIEDRDKQDRIYQRKILKS
ncbi:DUF3895 domain-containing protein [Peribacillus loiseleuriae]|uniref:DUF3895 domain-containing protein n=1 Tax=Peribacillus loiseleuriae TaxID=1679170 RepID=UPI003CFC655E